jgi:glycerol-3-phosphate dehydrogenase (NAD(P)+)
MAVLEQQRQNKRYLPGLAFPKKLCLTANIKEAASFSDLLLLSVPSHAFKETLLKLKPYISEGLQIAWATKGFNPDDGSFLHQTVENTLTPDIPTAILSGPTFANEVAAGLPTAITVASCKQELADNLAGILHSQRFRIYTSDDIIGVQVGGAVKNVLAIAAGIADGLGFGANTRAALITRGLQEVIRLGLTLGGKQETLMGLSGLGDLLLTCTDNQSRNRRFGLALGQGKTKSEIIKEINQEIEGISAARETYFLARKYNIDMPITEQTYKVLYEGLSPLTAVQNLLLRKQKAEN